MKQNILNSLAQANQVLKVFTEDPNNIQAIEKCVESFTKCFQDDNRVFSCGNGGSLCDSMHFAEELTGRYRKNRRALGATSIMDPSHMSCVGNDFGYDEIFSRYLEGWAKSGDILLAISTSGNSKNVINAVKTMKEIGGKTIGLLGKDGGELINLVDIPIVVDSKITDRIQEIHIKIIHIFIEGIERNLFPENYA